MGDMADWHLEQMEAPCEYCGELFGEHDIDCEVFQAEWEAQGDSLPAKTIRKSRTEEE